MQLRAMRGFGTRTRIVLIGVIALMLAGYGWWYFAPGKPAVPDVEIDVSSTEEILLDRGREAEELAKLPMFDPATGQWVVEGKPRTSIASLIRNRGQAIDSPRRVIVARLPGGADSDVMQAALKALAGEGICSFAFFSDGFQTIRDYGTSATVYRIRSVGDGHGGAVPCVSRANSPAS